jgi:hypothetical protein
MNLIDNVEFLWIASGYKSGSLFSIVPNTAAGDLTTFRTTSGSRINSGGLVEFVGPGIGRLDYATTSSCPFLRLESDRTNYIYSSDLLQDGTNAWSSGSLIRSFVTNSSTAPNGTSNVCLVTESTGTGLRYIVQPPSGIVTGSTTTYSFFAKRYGGTNPRNVGITNQTAYSASVYFILEGTGSWYAEAATTYKTNIGYVSGAMIEPLSNGWYRCSATLYLGTFTGNTANYRICLVSGNNITPTTVYDASTISPTYYAGDASSGLYLWGAQAESGSWHAHRPLPYSVSNSLVSSYISSSVNVQGTRAADRLIAIPTSSSPTSFTFYTVLKTTGEDSGGQNLALQSGSSVFTNFYYIGWTKGTVPIWNTGSDDSNMLQGVQQTSLAAGVEHKLAIRYSASLATWFRDGVMLGSQSFPIITPVWNYFTLGGLGNNTFDVGQPYTSYFRTVAVFNRGLTDAEAITLTT